MLGSLVVVANLALREGLNRSGVVPFARGIVGLPGDVLTMLFQPVFCLAVVLYGFSMLLWLRLVATEPLSLAYPMLAAVTFVSLSVVSIFLLAEPMGLRKAAGLAAVLLAVAVFPILYSFYISLFSLKLTRPNRVPFVDRLEHALARLGRQQALVAILFLDLDHFKLVNDSLGHHVGDDLLAAAAPRLKHALRGSDTVARFGGDEFGILLEDIASERDASNRVTFSISCMTAQAGTGALKPFNSCSPSAFSSKALPSSRRVDSETTIVSGSARACSREARFGVSPTTPRSRASPSPISSPTMTRPVEMPIRTLSTTLCSRRSSPTDSISARAARAARSASSSCARG